MGSELNCALRLQKQVHQGKALLETSELLFRGADGKFRLKILLSAIRGASASDGELRIETPEGTAIFELGSNAEKWLAKILHPKSRLEKLGIHAGTTALLLGEFADDFKHELRQVGKGATSPKPPPRNAAIFLAVSSPADLLSISKAAKTVFQAISLWVVYPKGRKDVTEVGVIAAGRKAGLKDVKVVAFSSTHTALKFVLPLSAR